MHQIYALFILFFAMVTLQVNCYLNIVPKMAPQTRYFKNVYGLNSYPTIKSHQRESFSIKGTITSTINYVKKTKWPSIINLWEFTRPHTILGSAISLLSLYLYAVPQNLWFTSKFRESILSAAIPSLLMNIYITGLNQVTDIEIDKINKPYLPIAAGNLTKNKATSIIISCLIGSIYLARSAAWPLLGTILGSAILGTIYSLPPFRIKRYPLLAALFILVVRGSLVNLGFFYQAKIDVLNENIPNIVTAISKFPEGIYLTTFFAIFGVVIAIMKDTPDVAGDEKFNIPSFSVKLGAKRMFGFSWKLLYFLLTSTSLGFIFKFLQCHSISSSTVKLYRILCATSFTLLANDVKIRAEKVDYNESKSIFEYYMHIWNIFYFCYFLLPFVR
jgi:homogentisate phytyltransferase/homogentisate geranylgeranyltransferase